MDIHFCFWRIRNRMYQRQRDKKIQHILDLMWFMSKGVIPQRFAILVGVLRQRVCILLFPVSTELQCCLNSSWTHHGNVFGMNSHSKIIEQPEQFIDSSARVEGEIS